VKLPKLSYLRPLVSRVFRRAVPTQGGYVFNFRGRWRYETEAQRRAQRPDPPREWSGEVIAYAWLSRQAKGSAQTSASPHKPDVQTLALTRC
jgi:hypothetical protein